ncbi:hypothetical protein A7982_13298 [Minicystis rosea]|nr:hypothetical protein A7982_13298 [Minicystis rosea]
MRVVDAAARPTSTDARIEIAVPNGCVVRVAPGFDPATLAQVLAIVARGDVC